MTTVMITPAASAATYGMAAAAQRFDASAQNVATASAAPTGDIAGELVTARVTAPAAYATHRCSAPPNARLAARQRSPAPTRGDSSQPAYHRGGLRVDTVKLRATENVVIVLHWSFDHQIVVCSLAP